MPEDDQTAVDTAAFLSPLRQLVLKPGDRVVLQGLNGRADLNGAKGKLMTFTDSRWRVEVEGGECVRVKAANVKREPGIQHEAPPAEAKPSVARPKEDAPEVVDLGAGEGDDKAKSKEREAASKKAAAASTKTRRMPPEDLARSSEERQRWSNRTMMNEVDRGEHERLRSMLKTDDESDSESDYGKPYRLVGANIDWQHEDWGMRSPLIVAAVKGHRLTLDLLIERGADVDLQDDEAMSALMHAAKGGDGASCVSLLNARAAVDLEDLGGKTALILAAMEGHAGLLVPLLNKGASPLHEDFIGFTALQWAIEEKHQECISILQGRTRT